MEQKAVQGNHFHPLLCMVNKYNIDQIPLFQSTINRGKRGYGHYHAKRGVRVWPREVLRLRGCGLTSLFTTGIRQFAVRQGGRQTPIWRTAKIFAICLRTVKQSSVISSAKRCITVCCISTDGKAIRRPLKWKQTAARV